MKNRIGIVHGNNEDRADLCAALRGHSFEVAVFSSLVDFDLENTSVQAVILDLDTVNVTNQLLQEYYKTLPGLRMIAISGRNLHPELRESMATCLTACLTKPVDLNELVYLLKGI